MGGFSSDSSKRETCLVAWLLPLHGLDDGLGIYPLMDMEGDGGDLKGGMLCLSGPDELRIEVRIVLIGLRCRRLYLSQE